MRFRHAAMLATTLAATFLLGCSAAIQHGLDEAAANEILTSLARAGIPANKSRADDGAFTVSVASADAPGAMELLRSLGLPRGKRPGLGEIYKTSSLIPTPTEERARYVEALASEVARTLETFDGVLLARVHLVLPEPDPLAEGGKPRVAAQAAVLLKLRPGKTSPVAEADVQKLVAGSVPGLAAAAVAVVVTTAAAPAAPQATLVRLGPLHLTPQSRGQLLALGAAAFAIIAVLAALVLLLARRLAAAQKKS
jgi:type III secretion protein J